MTPIWKLVRPMMMMSQRRFVGRKFNSNGNGIGLPSRVGLVLAAVFAVASTTNAFQLLDARRERVSWRVQCEGEPNGSTSTGANTDADFLSKELSDSQAYQRVNTPSRLELHTHAVSGLFDTRKIARYEVYKRLHTSCLEHPEDTHTHVVTALVDFGDSLDGHPGVVHGGVIALVLDDIFGFAFGAIGVPKAVTANLSLDYRAPTPASTSVMVKVFLERQENRKLYFKGEITSLDGSTLYTESSCLYIIPRSVWEEMGNK